VGDGDQRHVLSGDRIALRRKSVLLLLSRRIWGATVVADSAQFSSCVTELGDPQYIGTALTIQMCVGFLLTTISIELIPKVASSKLALCVHDPRAWAVVWRDRDVAAATAARSDEDRAWKTVTRIYTDFQDHSSLKSCNARNDCLSQKMYYSCIMLPTGDSMKISVLLIPRSRSARLRSGHRSQ
jgi:hypothetical protein